MANVISGIPPATNPIQILSVPELYAFLETRSDGLNNGEIQQRLLRYGRNTIREVRHTSLIIRFLMNFTHLMAVLLWIGGIIAFIAQMPQLGIAIWAVNLINGAFSFWQEFKAEKATEALQKLLPTYASVIRDGTQQRLLAEELVPGDIILLAEGDHISADARLIDDAELRVDQSTLTGESNPVRKTSKALFQNNLAHSEMPNLVFAGTSVTAGTGKAVIFATGMETEFGKIAHLTQSVGNELSPLQKEMNRATKIVTLIAIAVGVLIFILAVLFAHMKPAEGFIFALGMIVAFVPEGMLPTVTLALALGVQRMARRHALVKRLSAVETLGCTSVICTDKTGTLTQNEMTVRELWVSRQKITVRGVGYEPKGDMVDHKQQPQNANRQDLANLLTAAGLCNNARLLPPTVENTRWTVLGDPTEAALRVAAIKGGINLEEHLDCHPRLRELPFESRRKRMSTIHQYVPEFKVVYTKGAPKEILELCTYVQVNGQENPLTSQQREEIIAVNDEYARNGLRVLAVAMRKLPNAVVDYRPETIECDLIFLGLIAMMDPPRPEVSEAVQKCHRAGIRIIMITGDYGLTAESIAKRIGIIRGDHPRIISGTDLDSMQDDALKLALSDEVIFARVAPEHKMRVTSVLQDMGHVVAVTGDGVNDAPALKKADIGVAMGIGGTDVAKEAADMILTDDNFASIVNAVEEGRAVYANIKKFLTYIFTSNMPEAVPFVLFAFSGGRIPLALTVMQVLSIDLGTDMIPALALGAEAPEPGIMDKPPRSLKQHVITLPMLIRAYPFLGMLEGIAAMAAFYFIFWNSGYWGQWIDLPTTGELYQIATTMTLAGVVFTQIGNLFAQRTETRSSLRINPFNNRLIWVGIATELSLLCLISYVPFLQNIFGTGAIPLAGWLFLVIWTPLLLLADELGKAVQFRKYTHRAHHPPDYKGGHTK